MINKSFELNSNSIKFFYLIICLWFFSTIHSLNFTDLYINESSYFAAYLVAYLLIIINPQRISRPLYFIVAINLIFQIYEAFSTNLIFVYPIDGPDQYDESGLSMSDGSIRAKGFFVSPLGAVSVAMSSAILFPKSPHRWIVLLMTSLLSQGRLGLIVGFIGILVSGGLTDRKNLSKLFVYILFSSFFVLTWYFLFSSTMAVERFFEFSSAQNTQNISRLYFWKNSFNELLHYDLMSFLFGKYGFIKQELGYTECDWLRITLDNGFFCTLAFLIPLFNGLIKAVAKKDYILIFSVVTCFSVMMVFPLAQSFPNGILVCVFLLTLLNFRRFY